MKRLILTLTVLIFMASLAHAQQAYQFIRADIPFEFQVSGHVMPAGRYDFCWNRSFVAAVRLADRSARTEQPIQYVQINSVEPPTKSMTSSIVFHRSGNLYFLSEIRQQGAGLVTLTVSPQERNLAKLAKTKVEIQAESGK